MKIETPFYSKNITPTYDSDAIDRLRYFATVIILASCAFFIMAKQYVGQSIQCWMPKQFKDGWEQYAETYCLIENTYYVNMNDTNLPTEVTRENKELRYYQWVPFILFGLALVLYIPRVLWMTLQSVIGINISIVTSHLRKNATEGYASADPDIEKKTKQMQYKKKTANRSADGEFWGSRLTVCLMATKVFATVVILLSMGFMDYFMGMGPLYGWTVTKDLLQGRQWQESGTFPRVTFCDFQVRELGYVNNWSLQCVLMVNMFNEKLFIALWWWYVVLAVLSVYDIFRFIFRFTVHHQVSFISNILSSTGDFDDVSDTEVGEFNRKVLRVDGINLTHLIYANATIFEAADFYAPTWFNNFKVSASKTSKTVSRIARSPIQMVAVVS
ncbi:Protein CBR-INX-17 [Caenorhabditis briggsae]|uniref:Innexin n=1 Tax=Caenorhabditis briggsae TaxID=6238 RepID=A8XEF7_CAEBR|nr:Protein CBR-INX-17 [Caenorhabditis briggsae]CAP31092.2 Protein CBR-INX-17 [Caenorhabditis briggsae]